MVLSCRDIVRQYVDTMSHRFECQETAGLLRVITPYLYPNNDLIEVLIKELPGQKVSVTDGGETLRHLHSQGFDVEARAVRREMAEIIASRTDVDLIQGQLVKIGPVDNVGEILFDVIVAARGVSDLIYTSRAFEPATFAEEIGQFLAEQGVHYISPYRLTGQTGHIYTVQFRIQLGPIYAEPLSPRQPSSVRPRINSVFRMWYDCNGNLGKNQKLSILDDLATSWKRDDVALLERVSIVLVWSERAKLGSILGRDTRTSN